MSDYIQTGLSYSGPQGGSYGGAGGGTYGPIERGHRVDLYPPNAISRSISTDAIISVNIGLEHSALSDLSIDLPPFAELTSETFADGEMRYYRDGDLLMSAVIDEVNVASDYTVTLSGPAHEGASLDEGEIDIAFEDTRTADAIQYVIEEHTPHTATVHPAPERTLDDVTGQSARAEEGFSSILTAGSQANNQDHIGPIRDFPSSLDKYLWPDTIPSIHDTSPFVITADGLTAHQSCIVHEAEDGRLSGDTATIVSDSGASGGQAVRLASKGDAVEIDFKFQYNLPPGALYIKQRSRWGTTGGAAYDRVALNIDGSTFTEQKSGRIMAGSSNFKWGFFGGHYPESLDARGPDDDPHTIRIEKTQGDDELLFDIIAPVDDRYNHGFDDQEQVDGNNALSSPALYPYRNPVVIDSLSPGADIDALEIRTEADVFSANGIIGITVPSTGSTTSGGQLVSSNEPIVSFSHSFPADSVIPNVYAIAFLGRYNESNRTTTPTQGTEVQTIESFELSYSGTALSIIDGQQYQGSPLSVLQDLHDYSNRRFVIEHGTGQQTARIESFITADSRMRRDESENWIVTDVSRDTSFEDYANVVHVEGASINASQDYRATARDEGEIQALAEETGGDGVRAIKIQDTSLTSDNDCRSKARSELRSRTRQDTVGGSVSTTPQLPTPGKPYLATFLGGEVGGYGYDYGLSYGTTGETYSSLESVSYSESAGSASTSLDFERVQGLYRALEEFGPPSEARARTSSVEAQPAAISVGTISEDDGGDDDSEDDGGGGGGSIAYLDSDDPLSDAAYEIGGSAGDGTHGGQNVSRPSNMPTRNEANYQVSSANGLRSALDSAGSGDIIYIDDDIPIDSFDNYLIAPGVTLVAGFCDPNIPGRGPVLHSDSYNRRHFEAGGDLTLWGISMQGPREDYFDPRDESGDASDYYAAGIYSHADTFAATGCEFRGWTVAALELGASDYLTDATIDRCTFINNPMETYGYGIEQYNGHLDIGRCYFNYNRHSISGFGYASESYYLHDSMHGPDAISHAFDMHRTEQNLSDGDDTAGKFVHIENVTFPTTEDSRPQYSGDQEMCAIRGVSTETTWIRDCHVYHTEAPTGSGGTGDAWRQETVSSFTNFTFSSNNYGERLKSGDGCPLNKSVQ